jgi:Sap, sulfolipid-1-addressing protein
MADLIVQLIPMVLGAALAPLWVIIVLLMLASPQGLVKATAFVLGMTLARLLQGLIFGFVFGASPDAAADGDGSTPVVSTLLTVLGIVLLIAAYKKWRKEDDPDDPPPKWMQSIDQATPLKALGLGAALIGVAVKLWVFTLSALGVISAAGLGTAASVGAYVVYTFLAQFLLILAIVAYAVAPGPAGAILKRALGWLTANNRPITVSVSLIFGAYFLYSGLKGLLG